MLDHLVLNQGSYLPVSLKGVTQHHVDFIKCDNIDAASTAKELMPQQWSELVKPGCRVGVKIMDEFVVERTHFTSKLSFDCYVVTLQLLRPKQKCLGQTQQGCISSEIIISIVFL